jgi:hypothetical protein
MKPEAKEILPRKVLAEVACAIPDYVHPNIVIIGSLAAGYWLFQSNQSFGVRTKDIDCVLSPLSGPLLADGLLHLGFSDLKRGQLLLEAGNLPADFPQLRLGLAPGQVLRAKL